jgi:AraC family transcriptional regulator of adaptative response/methylated-DNA-[protein]-cysteine methyltransferase
MWITDLESPLGPMIAGATENGVSFLEWHDRGGVHHIRARVIKRYRCDLVEGSSAHLAALGRELRAYFDRQLREFTVPIDVTGTAFEQLVWRELLGIPYGETRSYGQIAASLDKPGASRAVGRANGANYLAIVIPCHRVIESNGNLRGYGGKLWRKRALLDLERGISRMPLETTSRIQNLDRAR